MSLRITNGALEESPNGSIVLRGAIDPTYLPKLKEPAYQREIGPLSTIQDLADGLKQDRAPDIELAQRSGGWESENGDSSVFLLPGPVYIIDGLQRVTAAVKLLADGAVPRIGALIHFNTTDKWERERFRILNQKRSRVSPNILLRNALGGHQVLRMLEELTHDHSFALADRVSWSQRMQRVALVTALSYCKIVLRLHFRLGGTRSSALSAVKDGLRDLGSQLDRKIIRENVIYFFNLIEDCWGIRKVIYRERATHLKGSFLFCLADVLADHGTFWRDAKLCVSHDWQRKLASFPVNDPAIVALTGASGAGSRLLLYPTIVNHLNSGKRNHKLVKAEGAGTNDGTRREVK